MESTGFNLLLWSDVIAGTAIVGYGYFAWAMVRGWIKPSARLIFGIRITVISAVLLPIAMRIHFSDKVILLISSSFVLIGVIIRVRRKLGI